MLKQGTTMRMSKTHNQGLMFKVKQEISNVKTLKSVKLEYDPGVLATFNPTVTKVTIGDYLCPLKELLDPNDYNKMTQSEGSVQKQIKIIVELSDGDIVNMCGYFSLKNGEWTVTYYSMDINGTYCPSVKKGFSNPCDLLRWSYPLVKKKLLKKLLK